MVGRGERVEAGEHEEARNDSGLEYQDIWGWRKQITKIIMCNYFSFPFLKSIIYWGAWVA